MYANERNQIKLNLYKKFYSKNNNLYETDRQLYWHNCITYVDKEFSKIEIESFAKELKKTFKKVKGNFSYVGSLSKTYSHYKKSKPSNLSNYDSTEGRHYTQNSERPETNYSSEETKKSKRAKKKSKKKFKKTTKKTTTKKTNNKKNNSKNKLSGLESKL